MSAVDAVVVGAGPNGLMAAITLARNGRQVVVIEEADSVGGACRSDELTLPGFVHDVGASILPLAVASPAFADIPLADYGLEWVEPPAEFGQPLSEDRAVVAFRDIERTAEQLGRDGPAYRSLAKRLSADWGKVSSAVLGPILRFPRHPLAFARFGLKALLPFSLYERRFRTEAAKALLAGCTAHGTLPFSHPFTTSFALGLLALGHGDGWVYPKGGAGRLTDALAAHLTDLGGEIRLQEKVTELDRLPSHRIAVFTTGPRQLESIAGEHLPGRYRRKLRSWPYRVGAFKIDYALDGPIPWADPVLNEAGTVHLGGTSAEMGGAERAVYSGDIPERPFVLLAQTSRFDPTRAPADKHTLWAYCHVPAGSTVDMSEAIESQIERFAPGFRDLILARSKMGPSDLESLSSNLVGGNVIGGSHAGLKLLFRPRTSIHPHRTPNPRIFIGSASTPPGGGVHGLGGWWAAHEALRTTLG